MARGRMMDGMRRGGRDGHGRGARDRGANRGMAVGAMYAVMVQRVDARVHGVGGRDDAAVMRGLHGLRRDGRNRGDDGGASRSREQQDGNHSDRDGTRLHECDGPANDFERWVPAGWPHRVR